MNALKSIITATDLSAPSRHAVHRSARLAHSAGARLTLLHTLADTALDDLRRWVTDGDTAAAVATNARACLHALASDVRERHMIEVDDRLALGHPVDQVIRCAEDIHADLIVTGTRGTGLFRGVVVGSTAERIAARAKQPVLMVRQSAEASYRRVLVPVDFSSWGLHAIELADQLAPQAMLVVMHAVELPFEGRMRLAGVSDASIQRHIDSARQEAMHKLRELVASAGLAPDRVRLVAPSGVDPWMQIARQEQAHDCDLIVIGRQGRHALDELLLGSTTRMVIAECSSDVLVSTRPAL